jgi:hypothetical protein
MAINIENEFSVLLHIFLKETFEGPEGIYLDPDTSLLQTLNTVTAEQASIPVGGNCGSIAAQVSHAIYYIESFERLALENDDGPRDWQQIWKTVEKVTPDDWELLKNKLKEAYLRLDKLFQENPVWNGDRMGGALSTIVHSAFHLGQIRQALCQVE